VNVNFKTSASYSHRLREIIAYRLDLKADTVLSGDIEVAPTVEIVGMLTNDIRIAIFVPWKSHYYNQQPLLLRCLLALAYVTFIYIHSVNLF